MELYIEIDMGKQEITIWSRSKLPGGQRNGPSPSGFSIAYLGLPLLPTHANWSPSTLETWPNGALYLMFFEKMRIWFKTH